jgi:hypothetical protein
VTVTPENVQDNLGINYKVSSFIKPGAQMNEITKTVRTVTEKK